MIILLDNFYPIKSKQTNLKLEPLISGIYDRTNGTKQPIWLIQDTSETRKFVKKKYKIGEKIPGSLYARQVQAGNGR